MQKKRKISIIITLVTLCTILGNLLAFEILNHQETISPLNITPSSKNIGTTDVKNKSAEINKKNYLIKTVYFDERKTAILKDVEGSELKLPITVSDKMNGTFSLQTAEGSPDNLKVGQTIILGKDNGLYSFVQ